VKGKLIKLLGVLVVLAMLGGGLAACGPAPEPETVIETVEVEKTVVETVEVEKTVVETVEVEVEKEVPVEVTVEVAAPTEPKSVTMTFFEEPDTLNTQYSGMWFAGLAIDLFNPGLWYWDNNLEPSLEMAAEFPTKENGLISEDGLTIEIPLNSEATWSDGEPVTANDFVFTYEMILDPGNIATQSTWPYDTYLESVTA
jgi:peptide/nickel transport system substrate-binding protein